VVSEHWKNVPPEIRDLFERMEKLAKPYRLMHWKLEGREVVEVPELLDWAQWMETADRHVGKTYIGEYYISTVFLGIDHGWTTDVPILFETMVFGPAVEIMRLNGTLMSTRESLDYQPRYSTYDEAEAGHQQMCEEIKRLLVQSEIVTSKALSRPVAKDASDNEAGGDA
jgi:hypothetical protein